MSIASSIAAEEAAIADLEQAEETMILVNRNGRPVPPDWIVRGLSHMGLAGKVDITPRPLSISCFKCNEYPLDQGRLGHEQGAG